MWASNSTTIEDITASQSNDGEVRCNLGNSINEEGFDNDTGIWGIDGFVSRPNDPDANGACQALIWWDGEEKRIIGTRDNRWSTQAGTLNPGDRAIVSNCSARIFLKQKNDTVTVYATDHGKPIIFEIRGDGGGKTGRIMATAIGSDGNACVEIKPGSILLAIDGGGSILIDKQGVHIGGAYCGINTGGGNLGTVAGGSPPPGANSILMGPAGIAGAPNPKWTIGT